jgi:hypothetical protein
MAALIQSWWLNEQPASDRLIEKTAKKIAWIQMRQIQARKSHTKTTREKLRRQGILLTELPRCTWGST